MLLDRHHECSPYRPERFELDDQHGDLPEDHLVVGVAAVRRWFAIVNQQHRTEQARYPAPGPYGGRPTPPISRNEQVSACRWRVDDATDRP